MSLKLLVWLLAVFVPFFSWANPSERQPPTFSYITPPKGWEIVASTTASKTVQIAFLKKTSGPISPSINLAVEKTDIPLQEYLKVIRQIHESDRRNRWRKLGKVRTQAGMGQLTEIDSTTESGPIRMLQLILPKQGYIYVVTAAAKKEEIAQYYKEFQSTFRTLQITPDLIDTVPQLERRASLKERTEQLLTAWKNSLQEESASDFQKEHWPPFQDTIVHDYEDMGLHWQFLMLKTVQEKIAEAKDTIGQNSL